MTQKIRVTFFFLSLLLSISLIAGAATSNPQPLFTDSITSTGPTQTITVMEQELLDQINAAATSIDAAFYDFNRVSIRDALIAAKGRGVTVRVVADDDAYANASYATHFAALGSAGIPVVNDGRSSIMHNKFAVFDGAIVWSGSTNWTDNGFTYNHNNSVLITSTELATIYTTEFNEMYVDGLFGTAKSNNTAHLLTINGVPTEIYFSPSDDALNEVIAEVNAANDTIHFSIFFFTDDSLRDAIIARMHAGVQVYAVWDSLGAGNQYSDDEALCDAGAFIKAETFPGKMHNKYMVIDANSSDPTVVTGSMNWSSSGEGANDENTLILHDSTIAITYLNSFQVIYDALPADTSCNTTDSTIYLPMIVTPTQDVLQVRGYVRLSNGDGVEGVSIYRAVGIGAGSVVSTTDANGYYSIPALDTSGEAKTIRLWADLAGYAFAPTEYSWTYDGGSSTVQRDFTATLTTPPAADLQITYILYAPASTLNEYVQIENNGGTAQDMTGWVLGDIANHDYTFPAFTLQPGTAVKVWTSSGANTSTDLYWGSGAAIWNNSGDTATLKDSGGQTVDSCVYSGGGTSTTCGN